MDDRKIREQDYVDMYSAGKSVAEIAKKYNLGKSTTNVYKVLKAANVCLRRKVMSESDISRMIEKYLAGVTPRDLMKEYAINTTVFYRHLKNRSVIPTGRDEIDWLVPHSESIKRLYLEEKKSLTQIAKQYGTQASSIANRLEKQGVERRHEIYRKYHCNEDFFSPVSDEMSAYVLGFMFADGYVSGSRLQWTLHKKDVQILLDIKRAMNADHPICYEGDRKAKFTIHNKKLVEPLELFGINGPKTFTVRRPHEILGAELMRHFIRGYFDGDGSISCDKRGYGIYTITSNKMFCEDIMAYLDSIGISIKMYNRKNPLIKTLRTNKRDSLLKLHAYMYDGATIFLERKHKTFCELVQRMTITQIDS